MYTYIFVGSWINSSFFSLSLLGNHQRPCLLFLLVVDRFHIALFYTLEQTHCARVWFYMSVQLFFFLYRENPQRPVKTQTQKQPVSWKIHPIYSLFDGSSWWLFYPRDCPANIITLKSTKLWFLICEQMRRRLASLDQFYTHYFFFLFFSSISKHIRGDFLKQSAV